MGTRNRLPVRQRGRRREVQQLLPIGEGGLPSPWCCYHRPPDLEDFLLCQRYRVFQSKAPRAGLTQTPVRHLLCTGNPTLEKMQVLLTTEPSSHPLKLYLLLNDVMFLNSDVGPGVPPVLSLKTPSFFRLYLVCVFQLCLCECRRPWRPGLWTISGAGVTGGCKWPHVDVGK